MHNRSALWQRRKINHCDLAHGRVEIKPSHVENRLSVTPPVASRAPSPHTITCKPPLHIQTASELLGAPWWTGLLVCRCCALTLLYVTPFDQVAGKLEWGEGVCHLWASDHDMPVHMSFVSGVFIVTQGSYCKTCIFRQPKARGWHFCSAAGFHFIEGLAASLFCSLSLEKILFWCGSFLLCSTFSNFNYNFMKYFYTRLSETTGVSWGTISGITYTKRKLLHQRMGMF